MSEERRQKQPRIPFSLSKWARGWTGSLQPGEGVPMIPSAAGVCSGGKGGSWVHWGCSWDPTCFVKVTSSYSPNRDREVSPKLFSWSQGSVLSLGAFAQNWGWGTSQPHPRATSPANPWAGEHPAPGGPAPATYGGTECICGAYVNITSFPPRTLVPPPRKQEEMLPCCWCSPKSPESWWFCASLEVGACLRESPGRCRDRACLGAFSRLLEHPSHGRVSVPRPHGTEHYSFARGPKLWAA